MNYKFTVIQREDGGVERSLLILKTRSWKFIRLLFTPEAVPFINYISRQLDVFIYVSDKNLARDI